MNEAKCQRSINQSINQSTFNVDSVTLRFISFTVGQ